MAPAAALSLRFPRVRHLWEAAPPDGTLCGKMRGLGYDRQQWSNFVQVREHVLLPLVPLGKRSLTA